VNEAEN